MAAPLIGITTYAQNAEQEFTLPRQYVDAVRRAGGIPVLLTPGEVRIDLLIEQLDGLLLSGGGDLDPSLYGGKSHETIYGVDRERDTTELALARQAIDADLPTLAICRGLQVVNVVLAGTLVEHLPDVVGLDVSHRRPPRNPIEHPITVVADTQLAQILGSTGFSAASWHHQAVQEAGGGLDVVAHAPDGTIEAAEMRDHRWLVAVQWHPELTAATDPIQQQLFDHFVAACRTN